MEINGLGFLEHDHLVACESVQLQMDRTLFLDKFRLLPLRFEGHAGDPGQIGQCDANIMQ
jgi:hypothetical protein